MYKRHTIRGPSTDTARMCVLLVDQPGCKYQELTLVTVRRSPTWSFMPVWLIDGNNVRGVLHFPNLGAFCAAVRTWAHGQSVHQAALVVLALDHGTCGEAFPLDERFVIAFSSNTTDADTLIAHANEALLDQPKHTRHEVVVVTSDQLLKQRCRHALPTRVDEVPCGEKRSRDELARLRFEGSASFAQQLNLTLHSASPLDRLMTAATSSRRIHSSESTAERTRSASRLHLAIAGHHEALPAHDKITLGMAFEWTTWHASACPFRMIRTVRSSAPTDGADYDDGQRGNNASPSTASVGGGERAYAPQLRLSRAPSAAATPGGRSTSGASCAVRPRAANVDDAGAIDWRLEGLLLLALMAASAAGVRLLVAFEADTKVLLAACPVLLAASAFVVVRTRQLCRGPGALRGHLSGVSTSPCQTAAVEDVSHGASHGSQRPRPQPARKRKKPRSRRT